MNLDRQKTILQEQGRVYVNGLSLLDCIEIVHDLGLDPARVRFEITAPLSVVMVVTR